MALYSWYLNDQPITKLESAQKHSEFYPSCRNESHSSNCSSWPVARMNHDSAGVNNTIITPVDGSFFTTKPIAWQKAVWQKIGFEK